MNMYGMNRALTKRKTSENTNVNRQNKNRKRQFYLHQRTCSICGAELVRPSMKICDSCTQFMRQKHIADL